MDLKFLREEREKAEEFIRRRKEDVPLEKILSLDQKRRALMRQRDELRYKRKKISENFSEEKRKEAKELALKIREVEQELAIINKELQSLLDLVPNKIHESVKDESIIVREFGEKPRFNFKPFTHWELGEALSLIDLKRAAKIAGSRFVIFKNWGALLERALINFCLNYHIKNHGYIEVSVPYLNKEECLYGAGQLPKLKDEMYQLERDGLYLIPTAEVALVNLHSGEILKEEELPRYYMAYTACFRREAGSYGQKVRGITRLHQFDKVELVKYTTPEDSYAQLEKMVEEVEVLLKLLKLPYRVKQLGASEMAFQSAKTYDIDVYSAGMDEWLEVSSISNCEDFQAKRNNTRFRRKDNHLEYVHILNGSGLAFPRLFIAIIENNQKSDGSITIPEVLRPYLFDLEKIS